MVKPVSVGKVIPLGERDILSDGTALYQLVLGAWCVDVISFVLHFLLYEIFYHSRAVL